eukprot:CAMPEP_0183438800 /NCGR_PEP_ID=MMETSP0370-20130417/77609_1 /TAXON_ID=268820 /ORGANISM="Peridinium aciculiferum, Strain PAER-2" /LENGTH=266 /DNA_ID=CAMNT_0025627101 /DNA_START=53 /DNA_END=853 /DNA_ORIENTATION=-
MSAETVTVGVGADAVQVARVPDIDDATWAELQEFLKSNPDQAKSLQKFAKDPEAMKGFLQTQAMAQHYQAKMESGDSAVQDRMKAMELDPELGPILEDIKKNGMESAMKHLQDEELMLKFSQKMGGMPEELQTVMKKIDDASLTLHEAAKNGDLKAVQEFLSKKKPLDAQDGQGITPLGYAIGANRIAVVKLLLDNRANPFAVDAQGNGGLHYASGYGRKELVEYMIKAGASVNQSNAQGQTPLSVATTNKQEACLQILRANGATA